jgi:hypothetical protein
VSAGSRVDNMMTKQTPVPCRVNKSLRDTAFSIQLSPALQAVSRLCAHMLRLELVSAH